MYSVNFYVPGSSLPENKVFKNGSGSIRMQADVVEALLVLEISNYAFIGTGSSVRITLTNVTVLSKWILIF